MGCLGMKRARRTGLGAFMAVWLTSPAHAFDVTPADVNRFSIGRTLMPPSSLDLVVLPDPALAPVRGLDFDSARRPEAPAVAARGPDTPSDVDWTLDYRHSFLTDTTSSAALRGDPSTGFSRQLDRDVVDLGLSWRLAGSRLGIGYELQSAREHSAADLSLGRFLPGSGQATHALTLGLTREWGAGAPPPVPVVAPPSTLDEDDAMPASEAVR